MINRVLIVKGQIMDNQSIKALLMIMLLSCFSVSCSELIRPPSPPQVNYAFNKFRPPPAPEPTFIQRITSWIFPWGGVSEEEEFQFKASAKIDNQIHDRPVHYSRPPLTRVNPSPIREVEHAAPRTSPSPPITKCSPCNKVPWIPMMPTYQLPLVNSNSGGQQQHQQRQIYFKHHFGNESPYAQIPPDLSHKYGPPSNQQPLLGKFPNNGHQLYGVPPPQHNQQQHQERFQYTTPVYTKTTFRPNNKIIDPLAITFTTVRPNNNNRPLRFTSTGSITNPEYIPPPNVLPLEGETGNGFVPIPIPNLSPTPIPPLFDAKDFNINPYRSQKTGSIKLVPLDPVAQVSNNVNVQVKPEKNLAKLEALKESPSVEVVNSNLVAEFTINGNSIQHESVTTREPFKKDSSFSLDVVNNLDVKSTIHQPIVVESLETVTDSSFAGSEHAFEHNVQQSLDLLANQVKAPNDDIFYTSNSNRFVNNLQSQEFIETTTTDDSYIVKFEPSIQTAADLAAEKTNKSLPSKNRDRATPLELLDLPIYYVTQTSTETPPPFKPLEEYTKKLATLWTSPLPISTSTDATVTPTYRQTEATIATSPSTSSPPTTLSFLAKLSSVPFLGITPPREPPKPPPSTKKPKQIQIVIPYTSYHKPSPFKVAQEQEIITYRPIRGHYLTHPTKKERKEIKSSTDDDKFNSHGYHNDQEYHEHGQESKIVESLVTVEPSKTTKYLTKILANNIRDLLKNEKTPKPPKIDIIKLQKNIDGWTEQSFLGKTSTTSLMGHTKAIPKSFLSTTMKATTFMKFPTTTLSPKTTFDPDLMEETKRQYDSILYKKDDNLLYVKRHDRFLDRDNELVLINNNLTYNNLDSGVKVFAPKTTLTPKELWKRLHVTISPLTNEKIYVVTPQPLQEFYREESTTFKPRFAVRPTVAGRKQPKKFKPEMLRRNDEIMDFDQVKTIDENSKVIRIITPQQNDEVTRPIEVTSVKP
ncbi:CLUMA_CG009974, isoform A [Clunio marinus]|uniref:CLUMA_CG009974, isoform A n=1 Tax=Clunio marinus TaxID=568069 RepID=A0A1J1IDM3_9DIPT|nr:CLUMA_CG009974, isoform A [Clunio marinus]